MQSESAKMTTAHEAGFRVQYPNSKQRAAKVIALDPASAAIVEEISQKSWNGAAFFTSLAFTGEGNPGAVGGDLKAWLKDLAGRTMDLVAEVEHSDFVVVITTTGADARAVSVIADACALFNKSLVGLIVPGKDDSDAATTESMKYLRPYTRMLVIASGTDYIEAMLTALRA
ncbi:hypothetical protein [Methylocella sp. CPCC 101449]|jgi:hypothetical protein|uniref:hypothetical protein n=1 Tax=Methylocella sp. CPCC 101449 TaxID=2987531 RepID=UPI00288E546C|nr:hypothetical protein [Methylocella sp. CPCC 101449]MDT2019497.1 hypothetical protein [Methylocella sp. CPCC 101449]HEV2572311.1 hypothetical protein [Beijerinckiaceae bacterium]